MGAALAPENEQIPQPLDDQFPGRSATCSIFAMRTLGVQLPTRT
jgi:hypothetical protein